MRLPALVAGYYEYLARESAASRCAPATVRYYRYLLNQWQTSLGSKAERFNHTTPASLLLPGGESWHRVQAVQRLFRWAFRGGLIPSNPVQFVTRPPSGQRERTLSRAEMVRLYRAASRPLRLLLFAVRHSLARPGEIRNLRWDQIDFGRRAIVLRQFKSQKRRSDKAKHRAIPLNASLLLLLKNLARKRRSEYVFLNCKEKPYSAAALALGVRRARRRAGLEDAAGEKIVCYTLRHTGATEATAVGLRDRMLADLMGHTKTSTTARYQHLATANLCDAAEQLHAARARSNRAA
jgi:integrase/recombinase XerD